MLPYFIAVVVTAELCLTLMASAEPEPEHRCFTTAETREKIPANGLFEPFHVLRSAAIRLQAQAIGVKLCRSRGELVYELSLLRRDGRIIHLSADAKTGEIIGSRTEQ
jgi:hypothetical protein